MTNIRKAGKLGKRPVNVAARRQMARFGDFFNAAKLPTPPALFGNPGLVSDWGMLANDSVGDCVIAGAMHQVMYWNALMGNGTPRFTDADAIDDYSGATGYVPDNPLTDQGTDMSAFPNYWKNPGLRDAIPNRHVIVDANVSLKVGDWNELLLAAYLFDGVGIGVNLPQSAEDQFNNGQPWTVVSGSSVIGGHYVFGIGPQSPGNVTIVTWGATVPMTRAWYEEYNDETNAYISLEMLNAKGLSAEGYDRAGLENYIASLE